MSNLRHSGTVHKEMDTLSDILKDLKRENRRFKLKIYTLHLIDEFIYTRIRLSLTSIHLLHN